MYATTYTPVPSARYVPRVESFTPSTTERFRFDTYCAVQVFLFLEPDAGGAISWDVPSLDASINNVLFATFTPLEAELTTPAASGALLLDTNLIFSNSLSLNWNTPLQAPLALTFWENLRLSRFHDVWRTVVEQAAPPILPLAATVAAEPVYPTLPLDIVDLATPYSALLHDLRATSPWRSWKKLAPLLGTSHTQLRRIADGTVAIPNADVAQRIDELHKFARRIKRLSRGDPTATTRLLTTPRARDGKSANDFLSLHDYRSAFRAIMDAASPRPLITAPEAVPLRWYDEPSRDVYDNGIQTDE